MYKELFKNILKLKIKDKLVMRDGIPFFVMIYVDDGFVPYYYDFDGRRHMYSTINKRWNTVFNGGYCKTERQAIRIIKNSRVKPKKLK